MNVRDVLQAIGTFGLGSLFTALIMHRLNDGRLTVRASWYPDPKLATLFPATDAGVRLHLVNVGRRPVRIVHVGARLFKPPPAPYDHLDHWHKDFKPTTLEPDQELDVDALDFTSFHENIKAILVEDVRGRRFKVGWRNMRELRRVKERWKNQEEIRTLPRW